MQKILKFARPHKFLLLFFAFIFVIFLANGVHTLYPDEFDNMLGGLLMAQAKLPYKNYFSQHGPFAYFLSAAIVLFTGAKFTFFRAIYTVVLASFFIGTVFLFIKRYKYLSGPFYLFAFLLATLSTYFWGHILLADSLAGWLLLLPYGLLLLRIYSNEKLTRFDVGIISLASALVLFSSLTYLFVVFVLNLITIFYYLKKQVKSGGVLTPRLLQLPLIIFAAPYLLFFVYFTFTGSLRDYIFQNLVFNVRYYATSIDGVSSTNFVAYIFTIANLFFDRLRAAVALSKDLNFSYPLIPTLAVGNLMLLGYFLIRKKPLLFFFVLFTLIFVNIRSSLLDIKETDYQSAPYIAVSLFNLTLVLTMLWKNLKKSTKLAEKILLGPSLLYLSIYTLFLTLFAWNNFFNKVQQAITKHVPLIHNHSAVAPTINLISSANDYVWVGPFSYEEWVYVKGKSPSRHYVLIPAYANVEEIKSEMVADFKRNKPKVVVFNKNWSEFNADPETFQPILLTYLRARYVQFRDFNRLENFEPTTKTFWSFSDLTYDFERDFYFDEERKDEILKELIDKKLIREKTN